jgi:membrane dipeptidase
MNRREFSRVVAGTAFSSLVGVKIFGGQKVDEASGVSAEAAALYERALVLDCNSFPALEEQLPLPQKDLELSRNSGVSVVKVTLGGFNGDFAATVEEIAYIQRMVELHADYFLQVRVAADMERAKKERKMGIICSFEGISMFDGKVERIEIFRNLGVRVMQLSYNLASPFGAGVLAPDGGGLTTAGHEAVKKMNEMGVAVDVSHCNAKTTVEALAASTKPVVITHAGCAAVHDHPRNKTDEQIRALAAKGGVMGIYDLPYLTASPKQPTVDDYMAHMEHALKVGGEEHVGVGSDLGVAPVDTSEKAMAAFQKNQEARKKSGVAAPGEDRIPYVVRLNTPRRLEIIADQLLKRGYSARVTEKVIGGNFSRVFGEVWS